MDNLFKKIIIIITVILVLITALIFKTTNDKAKSIDRFELEVMAINDDYEQHLNSKIDLEFVSDYKMGNSGYSFVLDSEGIILIHPHEDTIGLHLSDAFESYKDSYDEFNHQNNDIMSISEAYGNDYITFYYRASDGSILVSTAALKGNY
jgi:hypothetical protein